MKLYRNNQCELKMHSVDENVGINLDDQNDAQTKKIKKFGNANEFGHKFGKICKMVNCVFPHWLIVHHKIQLNIRCNGTNKRHILAV